MDTLQIVNLSLFIVSAIAFAAFFYMIEKKEKHSH